MTIVNIEAEQQLLGAILLRNDVYDRVADFLRPEHFAEPLHRRIFEICGQRIAKGHLVSPVTMKLALEGDEGLRQLGGPAYLARISGASMSSHAAPDYAGSIVEAACRRALNEMAVLGQSMLAEGRDSQEVKAALLTALHALPEAYGSDSSYSLLRSVTDSVQDVLAAYQGAAPLLRTGVGPLDSLIKGLAPEDLCLIGGATSMGKTSLALEIASQTAYSGKGVAFVSLEMSRQQLVNRMVAAKARIAYENARDPAALSEDDFRKWIEASKSVSEGAMRIVPRHVRDVPAIYSAVRRAGLDFPDRKPSLIVVDYAQLVVAPGKDTRERMTQVSISLKHLAGMAGCPVIAVVQLSRDFSNRDDKRPHLFDIKETGQFENDADQVIMCHREEYYLSRQGPKPDKKGDITALSRSEWEADLAAVRNRMELIVRKNRHGRIGMAEVGFHLPTNRFWTLGQDQEGFA